MNDPFDPHADGNLYADAEDVGLLDQKWWEENSQRRENESLLELWDRSDPHGSAVAGSELTTTAVAAEEFPGVKLERLRDLRERNTISEPAYRRARTAVLSQMLSGGNPDLVVYGGETTLRILPRDPSLRWGVLLARAPAPARRGSRCAARCTRPGCGNSSSGGR